MKNKEKYRDTKVLAELLQLKFIYSFHCTNCPSNSSCNGSATYKECREKIEKWLDEEESYDELFKNQGYYKMEDGDKYIVYEKPSKDSKYNYERILFNLDYKDYCKELIGTDENDKKISYPIGINYEEMEAIEALMKVIRYGK